MNEYIFDDPHSIIHSILGLITPIIAQKLLPPAIAIIIVFTAYEATEKENPVSTIGDFVEFLIGFAIGVLVATQFHIL